MLTVTEDPRPFLFHREQFDRMHELGWFAGQQAELIEGEVFVREGPDKLAKRRWMRDELFQMMDHDWFAGRRIELIGGEVQEMPAQYDLHAAGIDDTADALLVVFAAGFWVRRQASLDLSPHGIPDPDISVVRGGRRPARRTIATTALLVVEVSDSTLARDRSIKGSLYAAGGIDDYWIVNLVQNQLEVYHDPVADPSALFGARYATRVILIPGDFVSPLAAPNAKIAVADLLP